MIVPNVVGLKLWYDPVALALFGEHKLTPYGLKEKRRRRAASKVARASRRRNR